MTDQTSSIIAALNRGGYDPRPIGPDSWESRCPVHEGSRRNLSIRRGDDGRTLLFCHHTHESGGGTCDHKAIVAALGLTESDLFPGEPVAPKPSGKGRGRKPALFVSAPDAAAFLAGKLGCTSAKAWLYRHADGSEAFVVYRFDTPAGKTYRPVHKTPEGWRIGDPPGPLPLYNLPEVVDAVRVYLPEGEKAADVARRLGVVATASAHGAEAAAKSDWTPLAGKEVILLPDNDAPGEGYARAVLGLLSELEPEPTVRVVRLPGLPEGGDIVEWSESLPDSWGPDAIRAELERLADAAPVEELDSPSPDPEATVRPAKTSCAVRWLPTPEGTLLQCHDRDDQPANVGRVLRDLGDRARMRFLEGEPHQRDVTIAKADMTTFPDGGSLRDEGGGAKAAVTDADDGEPLETRPWPSPPDEAIYHGLAGEFVRAIEPQTEADPLGLLVQLLVMFGNMIGRAPHYVVEATRHHTNENVVLVGQSSQGRKGTSVDRVREPFEAADAGWVQGRIVGGLSSGEGLISAVRDPTWAKQAIKEKGRVVDYQDVMVDEGVADKRLLVLETEFGGVLRALEREGNKLSALLRQFWDHGNGTSLTKSPLKATGAHVSIIGHITADELLALLSRIDAANGFANRFLWVAVRRTKYLPFGGAPADLGRLSAKLTEAADFARDVGRLALSRAARVQWETHYFRLTTPPPGVLGAVTSRAAPHTLRLAMLYALMDRTASIADDHLRAAMSLWDASARCASYIFGDALGNPDAERILSALRSAPGGLTRAEIRGQVFQRNAPSDRIKAAMLLLLRNQLIREERDDATGGRPACRYYAINAVNAKSPPPNAEPETTTPPYGVNGVNGVNGVHLEAEKKRPQDEREVIEL